MHEFCVVFDIDDTLYLERDYVRSGFRVLGGWAREWLDFPDFHERCWAEFESGRRSNIFDHVLRNAGHDPSQALVSCLVELYRSHRPDIRMLDDAANAVKALAGRCTMAVVSDGPLASQSRKAEALGLGAFASPIVLTGIFGQEFSKPHTRAFAHVAQHVAAKRYLYVADNPAKDFAGPRTLGWTTIRIRRTHGLHHQASNDPADPPDFELSTCSDLTRILEDCRL